MAAFAWPLVALITAVLAYRFAHKYLTMSEVTKAHEAALDVVVDMHGDLAKQVVALEGTVTARLKEIEDRVKGDSSFRAVAGMMAPVKR